MSGNFFGRGFVIVRLGRSEHNKQIRDRHRAKRVRFTYRDRIFTNRETHLPSDLQQEVRCHPLIGAALLKDIDFLKPAVDFVLFHHEQEDGNGYPFGLRAGEIPPGAKIVSIADCFDAVTTDRPYQKGQSAATAYEILREGCRRFFCEEYVETFIEEIEENGIIQDTCLDPLLADQLVLSAAGCSAR